MMPCALTLSGCEDKKTKQEKEFSDNARRPSSTDYSGLNKPLP
jgi:hypothetical protein